MQNAQFITILGLLQNPSIPKGFWWRLHPKLWKFGTTSHVVFLVQTKEKISHNLDKPL
jgi:hypothetical protein